MESNSEIGVLGGQGIAVSDVKFPIWFEEFKPWYAVGKQAISSGDISDRMYVWGAGMITRKSIFLSAFPMKYPSLLSDRQGNQLSSGGDSEFCMRAVLLGYKLFYNESLIFEHYIPKERLCDEYRDKLFEGVRVSRLILKEYEDHIYFHFLKRRDKCKILVKSLIHLLLCNFKSNKHLNKAKYIKIIYHLTNISTGYVKSELQSIVNFTYDANK
jgi:hypothetical protein